MDLLFTVLSVLYGFHGDSDGTKNLPAMQETQDRSLGSGRCLGEGNGYPLQCSCLENPMDRGDWQTLVHGVTTTEEMIVL